MSVCSSTGLEQDLVILKAQVLASMKQTLYKVSMAMEKDQGRVGGACCECVAGCVDTQVSILLLAGLGFNLGFKNV